MKNIITVLLLLFSLYGYGQKQDTIKVIMLVTDTSINRTNAYWIRGYKVIENNTLISDVPINYGHNIPVKHIYYLKENKQRPIKLIIWQAIEI